MKSKGFSNLILNLIFILLSAFCIFPLLLTVSISLSSESSILENGYTLIPKQFTLEAYKYIVQSKGTIINAYVVTIFTTVVGMLVSTLIIALYAYPLSRPDFKWRNVFTFYVFFTMLFSGGTVAWYMVCTNVLHLSNTIWSMIVPYLMNAWYVIIMRTFFATSVPSSIIESAKLDGAGEYRILFTLVLPISIPGIATIALFQTLHYWNDWWLPLMFVTEPKLFNLQFLLKNMMSNIQALFENQEYISNSAEQLMNMPREGTRMALCIVVMGPILIVYPFFQKYFIQGLTVGALKG